MTSDSTHWGGRLVTGGFAGFLLLFLSRASQTWSLLIEQKRPIAATLYRFASRPGKCGSYRDEWVPLRRGRTSFDPQSSASPSLLPEHLQGRELDKWLEGFLSSEEFETYSTHQITSLMHELWQRSSFSSILRITEVLSPCQQSVEVYTVAMSALSNSLPKKTLELFLQMEARQLDPSSRTMAAVMTALVQEASDLPTFLAWHDRLVKFYPKSWTMDSKGWDALFLSLSYLNDPRLSEACNQLWSRMKMLKVEPTAYTFHNLFLVHTSCRNSTMTETLLNDLVSGVYSGMTISSRVWSSALQAFASSGDYISARKALLQMRKLGCNPSVRHYNSYLKALSPDARLMLQVLRHMAGLPTDERVGLQDLPPTPPDLIAVKTVLHSCSECGDNETARQLLHLVKTEEISGIQLDEQCYNLLLSTLDNPEAAKEIIKEMRLSRRHRVGAVPPSLVSYTQAITVCRRASDLTTAFYFLELAQADRLTPDVVFYTAILWVAARSADLNAAWHLIHEMQNRSVSPNTISFNGLIAAGITSGSVKDAVDAYLEMLRYQVAPNAQTYQILARSIRNMSNATEAVGLLSIIYKSLQVDHKRVEIAGPVLEALIYLSAKLGDFERALNVYRDISGPADASCLRAILLACSVTAPPQWETALTILASSDVRRDSTGIGNVDTLALTYVMLACSKANQWEESLRLWRLHGDNDTSQVALSSLIGACGRCGRPDMAMAILNEMEDRGLHAEERCYRSSIVACNQAEHKKQLELRRANRAPERNSTGHKDDLGFEWWECALSLIYRMRKRGLTPDAQSYTSAISACEAAGQWQGALRLLQTLLDEVGEGRSDSLSLYCFSAAISACSKGGAWVEALEVYERLKAHGSAGLKPDVVTLGSLIEGLDRAGQKELAQEVYLDGLRSKSINPWRRTRSSKGETMWAMDLHSFTAAMARAAIRSQLDSWILKKGAAKVTGDWVVVVGKGLRSADEPVLLPSVLNLLLREYGIKAVIDPQNCGRIAVPSEQLKAFLAKHH